MSAQPGSGKTRALEVSELLVLSPKMSASMSAAALVRIIAKARKDEDRYLTILYDEIDGVFGKAEEGTADLRSALNAGYRRNGMFTRCINSGASVEDFPCYAALAVAGLNKLPDALANRSIFVHMKPRAADEAKEDFRLRDQPAQAEPIYDAIFEWCERKKTALTNYRPELPESIRDRAADIWEPLIAIADVAGGDWPGRARAAAIALTDAAKDATVKTGSDIELLIHIREAFLNADKIHADELVRRLCNREESPWMDMGRGKSLTTAMLRERVRPYGVKSRQVKIDGGNQRGYRLEDFHDAWKHYVDTLASPTATAATAATKLMNKDKKVTLVAPVAPGSDIEADDEPGSFEPDSEE